jgi:hypothetical protein
MNYSQPTIYNLPIEILEQIIIYSDNPNIYLVSKLFLGVCTTIWNRLLNRLKVFPEWIDNPQSIFDQISLLELTHVLRLSNFRKWSDIVMLSTSENITSWCVKNKLEYINYYILAVSIGSKEHIDVILRLEGKILGSRFWNLVGEHGARKGNSKIVDIAIRNGADKKNKFACHLARNGKIKVDIDDPNIRINEIQYNATYGGYFNLIPGPVFFYPDIIRGAAAGGRVEIIKKMFQLDFNMNWENMCLIAARHGQLEVVHLISNYINIDWNDILWHGIISGHINVIEEALSHNAKLNGDMLNLAVMHGQLHILHLFGNINQNMDIWRRVAREAACRGLKDILQLAINNGADNFHDIGSAAAEGGYLNIVKWIMSKYALSIVTIIYSASRGGYNHIISYFTQYILDPWWDGIAIISVSKGELATFKLAVKHGADYNLPQLKHVMYNDQVNMIRYLDTLGVSFDWNDIAMISVEYNSMNVLNYALHKNISNYQEIVNLGNAMGLKLPPGRG